MQRFLTILFLLAGFASASAQVGEEIQVDAWSDSPAKSRLEQIEKYKPQVRRSRIIAIEELETNLKSAKESIFKAKRMMNYQLSPDGRRSEEAWDSLQIETSQASLDSLQAFVKEAETFLAYAKAENEKVVKYLVRERKIASDSLSGDAEEDDEERDDDNDDESDVDDNAEESDVDDNKEESDVDDNAEGINPDPQLRVKTRLSTEEEEADED